MSGKAVETAGNHDKQAFDIPVRYFVLPSGEEVVSTSGAQLFFDRVYRGDRDEEWIRVMKGDIEVSRFNCRYVANIVWERQPT